MAGKGVSAEITTAENVLRDLIEDILREKHGDDWLSESGLTEERVQKLRDAFVEQRKKRDGGRVSERLIYYAHLWDIETILKKNWDVFADCFGDQKTMRVYMERLASFRNPEMHGRELLPFEEQLVLGISGEIRNKVTIFRSQRAGEPEHFPRIESAVDSFGNAAELDRDGGWDGIRTGLVLRPGDTVTFELRAWDPQGRPWGWDVLIGAARIAGFEVHGDRITWNVGEEHIADPIDIAFYLRGEGPHHRSGGPHGFDGVVHFEYRVLPAR